MKILVFGNPLVEQDNTPIQLLPKLRQQFPNIEFKHLDSTENLQQETDQNKNLIILDTIQNTKTPITITLKTEQDFQKLELPKALTMHDFDLAYNLRLLKKVGLINQVKIIGIPEGVDFEKFKTFLQSI